MLRTLPVRFYFAAIALLVGANFWIYTVLFASPAVRIDVFAEGEGRVVLVHTPHALLLIDTGEGVGVLRDLGRALYPWQRSLDTLVLTGSAAAEAGGAPDVLKRYRTALLVRAGADGSRTLEAALAAASAQVRTTHIPYGAQLSSPEILITVLAPGLTRISYQGTGVIFSSTTLPGTYAL